MKRVLAGTAAVALTIGLVSCSDNPPTLNEQLVALCEKTVRENESTVTFGKKLVSMNFTDMKAGLFDGSKPTERWLISGQLVVTAEPETTLGSSEFAEDVTSPAPEVDPGQLKCRMGHRKSDDKLVVFQFSHYHPTSGGAVGKQLVFEEGNEASSTTSDWG